MDSWAKIPSGIMKGNFWSFGNYEECVNINTKLPFPYGTLEGQYCFAGISMSSFSEEVSQSQDFANRMTTNKNSIPLGLKNAICIPKICKPDDLKDLPFQISDCKLKAAYPLTTLDYIAM